MNRVAMYVVCRLSASLWCDRQSSCSSKEHSKSSSNL